MGLALLLAQILLVGCASIQVYGASKVTRTWAFAPLQVVPAPGAVAMVVTSRGFGLAPGANGLTLGYRNESWAAVSDPSDCRVIFFGASPSLVRDRQVQALAATHQGGDICIISRLPGQAGAQP